MGQESWIHIDHAFPWSLGEPSTPENLVVACVHCNRKKGVATDWKPYPLKHQKERIRRRKQQDERWAERDRRKALPKPPNPVRDDRIMTKVERLRAERQVDGISQDDWNAFNRAIAKDSVKDGLPKGERLSHTRHRPR